jgi:hypothetical protein
MASPIGSQQSASAEYAAASQALWSSILIRVSRSVFISSFFIASVPGLSFLQRTKGVILCSSRSWFLLQVSSVLFLSRQIKGEFFGFLLYSHGGFYFTHESYLVKSV